MATPQQPELRRSGRVTALNPDHAPADMTGATAPAKRGPAGPIPEANLPGHHDVVEQDQPDLDAFAEKLGIPLKDAELAEVETSEPAPGPEGDAVTASLSEEHRGRLEELGVEVIGVETETPDPQVGIGPTGNPMPAGPSMPKAVRWGAHLVLGPVAAMGHLADHLLRVVDGRPRDTGAED